MTLPHPNSQALATTTAQPQKELAPLAEVDDAYLKQLYAMYRNTKEHETALCQPTRQELIIFAQFCAADGSDPFAKDIYFIKDKKGKVHYQISIDRFRSRSEETGEYAGRIGPHWCDKDGVWHDFWIFDHPPVAARVGIRRKGQEEIVWGFCRLASYCKNPEPWSNWAKMPEVMSAKCAESQAHRAAFPRRNGKFYIAEEMAEFMEVDSTPLPAAVPVKKFGSPNVTPESVLVEHPAEPEASKETLVKKAAGLFGGRILDAADAEEVVDITENRPLDNTPEPGLFDPPPAQEFDPENDPEPASPAEVDEAWKAWVKVYGREREGQEKLRSIGVPTLRGTPIKKFIRIIHEHLNALTQEASF